MAHEPIQFGPRPPRKDDASEGASSGRGGDAFGGGGGTSGGDTSGGGRSPKALDLKKDEALTVTWADGTVSVYPIAYLRRMSPSAEARVLREEMKRNPLAVMPSTGGGPLTATGAERVGHYAIRIRFSDGHDTGIYSWAYLREIDPGGAGRGGAADDAVRP